MNAALRKLPTRVGPQKPDRSAVRGELIKLLGLAVLFAAVMILTGWASAGLAIAG